MILDFLKFCCEVLFIWVSHFVIFSQEENNAANPQIQTMYVSQNNEKCIFGGRVAFKSTVNFLSWSKMLILFHFPMLVKKKSALEYTNLIIS